MPAEMIRRTQVLRALGMLQRMIPTQADIVACSMTTALFYITGYLHIDPEEVSAQLIADRQEVQG